MQRKARRSLMRSILFLTAEPHSWTRERRDRSIVVTATQQRVEV